MSARKSDLPLPLRDSSWHRKYLRRTLICTTGTRMFWKPFPNDWGNNIMLNDILGTLGQFRTIVDDCWLIEYVLIQWWMYYKARVFIQNKLTPKSNDVFKYYRFEESVSFKYSQLQYFWNKKIINVHALVPKTTIHLFKNYICVFWLHVLV